MNISLKRRIVQAKTRKTGLDRKIDLGYILSTRGHLGEPGNKGALNAG
jgi:hypothetical protein